MTMDRSDLNGVHLVGVPTKNMIRAALPVGPLHRPGQAHAGLRDPLCEFVRGKLASMQLQVRGSLVDWAAEEVGKGPPIDTPCSQRCPGLYSGECREELRRICRQQKSRILNQVVQLIGYRGMGSKRSLHVWMQGRTQPVLTCQVITIGDGGEQFADELLLGVARVAFAAQVLSERFVEQPPRRWFTPLDVMYQIGPRCLY